MPQSGSKLGWMEPVFYGHTEDGQPIGAMSPEQFERIRQGYGCPRCWQEFAIVFTKCPVCQLDLSGNLDPQVREYPVDWTPGDDREKRNV